MDGVELIKGRGKGEGFVENVLEDAREWYLKYENYVLY